jgi:TonB family protein
MWKKNWILMAIALFGASCFPAASIPEEHNPVSNASSGKLVTVKTTDTKASKELEVRLKRAWFPTSLRTEKAVVLSFKTDKTGNPLNLEIIQSSGNSTVDQAAVKAVNRAAPFKEVDGEIRVEFARN